METDSPEPDVSPAQSSPEVSPERTSTTMILTPPAGFADSSLQSHPGTLDSQNQGTTVKLKNCGRTYSVLGQIVESSPQCHCDSHADLVSRALRSNSGSREDGPAPDVRTSTPVSSTESVFENPAFPVSFLSTVSLLQCGPSSSVVGAASTTNCTFSMYTPPPTHRPTGKATPGSTPNSSSLHTPCPKSSTRKRDYASSDSTPCIILTESVMGISSFDVRSLSSELQTDSYKTTSRTPDIVEDDSREPGSCLTARSSYSTPQQNSASTDSLYYNDSQVTSNICVNASAPQHYGSSRTAASAAEASTGQNHRTSVYHGFPLDTPVARASHLPAVFRALRAKQMMEKSPFHDATCNNLADCQAQMNSAKRRENALKEELQDIKGQYFDLLDNIGLSHDIYYNTVTPAQTPQSVHLQSHSINNNIVVPAATHLSQCCNQNQIRINNNLKSIRMSSQEITPRRRNLPRQSAADRSSMYADLLIDQLLARAQTDSGSSNSNSPPSSNSNSPLDVHAVSNEGAAALPDQLYFPEHNVAGGEQINALHVHYVHGHINFNRGSGNLHHKENVKSRFSSPDVDASETIEFESELLELTEDSEMPSGMRALPMVVPQHPVSYKHNSNSVPVSSNSSSSNSSVPDLDKELVSRMQYYSDFTIDRQKKIDTAVEISESTKSTSPTSTASGNSSEHISPRCVEGSENKDLFKKPLLINKPPVSGVPLKSAQMRLTGQKDVKMRSKNYHCSSESDTSSGTGSMPRSQYSSRPSSHSSNRSSKRSSCNRQSACSSDDHRSSSRGSRCSSHPLASSTLISDPSNSGSAESGSIYTWSMDNNSDENLHQSFLRSEKRQHRCSRPSHRRSYAHKSSYSRHATGTKGGQHRSRPDTLIGEDSPPLEQPSSSDVAACKSSLKNSAVVTPSRRFGSTIYENCAQGPSELRSASLPRTSTQKYGLVLNREASQSSRAASNPELSSPTYFNTNCAVSMIDPNCDMHHSQVNERCSPPLVFRPELLGKSSPSGSSNSYYSQCLTCNPAQTESCYSYPMTSSENEDHCDDILTNSPHSVDSGAQPPYNSYTSPVGSTNEYTTISDSSAEQSVIITSAPRQPRAFAVKDSSGVFKVPFSPASRTVRRKVGAGGRPTHNVGVRTAGTPCLPVGLAKHTELNPRKKLFMGAAALSDNNNCHPPKIFDKRSLARKIKKFSSHFKKDKGSTQIHTLANL